MPKKLIAGLLLLVLLPLAALGWLTQRTLRDEQGVLAQRLHALQLARLKEVDVAIQRVFSQRAQTLLTQTDKLPRDPSALRQFAHSSPHVRQIVLFDANGKLLFPLPDSDDPKERQFLERIAVLRDNPQLMSKPAQDQLRPVESNHGWLSWHWNQQLHVMFWRRIERPGGPTVLGLELDPARLAADLIVALPDSPGRRPANPAPDPLGAPQIRLIDANGLDIYQWGPYEPGNSELSQASLPLSAPLGSWRLELYGAGALPSQRLAWIGGLLAAALALCGMAAYLYREHTRELRLASQRVNFVNQVSHELKTPLTNIRLYAELLQDELEADDPPPDSPIPRYIGVITAESLRLSRLINNVLNFARLQKQRQTLQSQPTCLDQRVQATVETFRPALEARGVAITLALQAAQPAALDVEVLEQILNNLLSNVEKYGAGGGRLDISITQHPTGVVLRVQDYGPGIPPTERERIFEPFYRLSSKLTDGVTGTGIGLGIARDLARLHGGDLRVVDSAHGACFELTLATSLEVE